MVIKTRLLFNDNESKTSQIFANRKFVLYCREVVYVRLVVSLMVDKKKVNIFGRFFRPTHHRNGKMADFRPI